MESDALSFQLGSRRSAGKLLNAPTVPAAFSLVPQASSSSRAEGAKRGSKGIVRMGAPAFASISMASGASTSEGEDVFIYCLMMS